jgi:hypothetical protein
MSEMIFIAQKPLKDIKMLDVALAKIPTKELYKLQVSVAQEIQSRARADATNLQVAQKENLSMKEALSFEAQQKERAQQKVEEMEHQIHMLFQAILENTNEEAGSSKEKLCKIEQTIQEYKEKIKELEERVTSTTPLEVRVQQEQEATTATEDIGQSIQIVTELLNKSAQLWTHLLEDGSLQELQEKESKIHAIMEEVKQRQKIISLPEKIKMTTEEKVLQAQKIARQALLEPLQQKEEQLVMESDATKRSIEQIGVEGGEMLQSLITEQVVTIMAEKSSQAQQQFQQITEMYDAL